MKRIDFHTHVFPHFADLAVEVMDKAGIDWSVTLEWHNGFGDQLAEHLRQFRRYPGRFVVFGNVDFRRINEPDFAARAVDQLRQDAERGSRGLKIYKALGLEYRQPDGQLWRVNDERLDPIWDEAGRLGLIVLIHTADPGWFWEPVNDANFWNGVLYGEYAWWGYYRKGLTGRDELLGERNEIFARHPQTTFVCPHLGGREDNLPRAAADLDRYPNLHYDFSARIPCLGLRDHASDTRDFFIRYQDRLLFGTDAIYDDTNVPTGIQAQCLCQPGEIPLAGAVPRDKYVRTTVEFCESHYRFLDTKAEQHNPPFKRNLKGYSIVGLDLPETVRETIYHRNAEKLLPTR